MRKFWPLLAEGGLYVIEDPDADTPLRDIRHAGATVLDLGGLLALRKPGGSGLVG